MAIYDGDPYWKIYREITWKHMKPYLPRRSGAKVLDAGGGTGVWAVKLARSGFQVTLADTSQGMLESARKKILRTLDRVLAAAEAWQPIQVGGTRRDRAGLGPARPRFESIRRPEQIRGTELLSEEA